VTAILLALATSWTALLVWLNRRQAAHLCTLGAGAGAGAGEGWLDAASACTAIDVTLARTRLTIAGTLAEGAVVALLLGGGVAALDGLFAAFGPVAGAVALVVAVVAARGAVRLAVQAVGVFGIDARHGLNRASPGLFLADAAKRAALSAALGLPALAAVAWLADRGGRAWWLWAWGLWFAVAVLRTAVQPLVAATVLNRSAPLADARLAGRLEALLTRCGLRLGAVRVVDASRRTRRANASVVGFGAARRIMLHDTLLERLAEDEVEAVVAHEAGHARHHHVARYLAGMAATGFAAFAAFAALGPVLGGSVGERLAVFVLVLPLVGLFLRPVAVRILRGWEYQADAFAARNTSAEALSRALVKLYAANANAPGGDPLHAAFHASHPEPAQRLARLRA